MKRWILGGVAVALVIALAVIALLLQRDAGYDAKFDTHVAAPAYPQQHPRVLFDQGHHNAHAINGSYRPFVELLRNDGYDVEALETAVTPAILRGVAVLVIVSAQGANETNDGSAFTEAEASAISEWVLRGGALLLITDHWPFGAAAGPLGERFGVDMSKGVTSDPAHSLTRLSDSHLVFSRENGLLGAHPIMEGRGGAERITRLLTFTGQSLRGPADATPLLLLADTARDAPPGAPVVTRNGGEVQVSMTYGEPRSAAGWAQGVAISFVRGRVVVLGEAGMLRAAEDEEGRPFGMNYPGYDNRQFALNAMHWLSRLI
ncbi:DUF4350 domain-containing protein [Terricaulis sp.]|uniref:DUF4350 domain-containing protein n=1 Tax=Terricaulis sp. TaxID=2768686 RepID=UPI003784A007